jgi:hypothetical protein
MMLWHMGPRQSLSEVIGTHVVSACKWIITVFYTQYRSPPLPPPQSMLLQPKHIKPDEKWDTTLSRGRGGLSFVEIQRFCGICPNTFETDCSLVCVSPRLSPFIITILYCVTIYVS